ncbi:MAG: cell division protein FtsZ [Candidatus Methanomethylophilaceae archaeon]|nr:cell division protein FtsZ [Candidatus Methanomethylophilaceae archaeon]MDI3541362.1 cell division protein FtsZ [Candidatus Methanomethylophilaceae archaeon]
MGLPSFLGGKKHVPAEHPVPEDIIIVGVGNGGCSIVNRLNQMTDGDIRSLVVNTDKKSLSRTYAEKRLFIGSKYPDGGTKGSVRQGKERALSSRKAIASAIRGADLILLLSTLGGGTGTGASPVIARQARKNGTFVLSVVTIPSMFEKKSRKRTFKHIKDLRSESDMMVLIDDQLIMEVIPPAQSRQVFSVIDQLISEITLGIMAAIDEEAMMSVSVSKLRKMAQLSDMATVMWGESLDPFAALNDALENPLLLINGRDITSALLNVCGGKTMDVGTVNAMHRSLTETLGEGKDCYCSAYTESSRNSFRVMVLTGVKSEK